MPRRKLSTKPRELDDKDRSGNLRLVHAVRIDCRRAKDIALQRRQKAVRGHCAGGDSVRNCFREHIHELSSTCVLALIKLSRVDPTCKTRLNRECANVKPGEGRLAACL